jgi:hypothetical protein
MLEILPFSGRASAFRVLGCRVLGAKMGCKFSVAMQLEDLLHLSERFATECIRRAEYPGTFGATPTLKMVMFDPHELTYRRHYRRKTKSRPTMFRFILCSLLLKKYYPESFSAFEWPSHESAQLAVSIVAEQIGHPESISSDVYLWRKVRTNRR